MKKDFSAYYKQPEFISILNRYNKNKQGYFDIEELEDLADYYLSQYEMSKALEVINHSIRLHPQSSQLVKLKFSILILLDDKKAAQGLLHLIPDDECKHEKFILKVIELLDNKQIAEALQYCNRYLLEKENLTEKAISIASLFANRGYIEEGIQYLKASIAENPDDSDIQDALAEIYLFADRGDEAIPIINELLDKAPYSIDGWMMLGEAYLSLSDYNQALEAYEFAEIIDPEQPEMILKMGHCYFKLENYAKAIDYYLRYLKQDSFFQEEAYFFLGLCFYSLKKWDEAITNLKKSIESEHKAFFHLYNAYSYLSLCYTSKKEYDKAIIYIDLAIKENPEEEGYLKKSQIYLIADKINEARYSFREIMRLSDNKERTLKNIENIFKKLELKEEGETILKELREDYMNDLYSEQEIYKP